MVNPDGPESVELITFVITSPVPTTSPTTPVTTTATTTTLPAAYSADSDDDGPPATIPADRPLTTVTVNTGGNSKIGQAVVTSTNLKDLIVTAGTVLSGPGRAVTAAPGTIYQYISIVPARYTNHDHEGRD